MTILLLEEVESLQVAVEMSVHAVAPGYCISSSACASGS